MAIAPENTNFVTGDILSASQYNETHNTAVKLALEDNSRIVLPTSNAPSNISDGHWVLGAIAGDYINFNGVGTINTPSVLLYDLSTLEWLVYPLVNTAVNTDMSLTVWDQYTYYVAEKDFVYYVNTSSTTDSFKVPFIYKCSAATTPLQSPETHPLKWSRTGVYINENTILTLSNSVATLSDNVSSLTTTVNGHTTSIANLVQSDVAINLRIDSVENLISTLGIDQLAQTLEALQTNVSTLSGRVSETESDITTLDSNFSNLETTLLGAITSLTGRVGIVESSVTTLQGDFTTLDQNMTVISQEFDVVKAAVGDIPTQISALDTRVTEVELTVDALDLAATNARITTLENTLPLQIQNLNTEVDTIQTDLNNLDGYVDSLSTTIGNTDTLLNNTITRVTQAEVDIDELQIALGNKAEVSHDHILLYEPKNNNIQSHIATNNIHFTQDNIVITKSQISDLGPTVEYEIDPVFTASQASLITETHIATLNNTSGINTGDQDLTGLSPLVHTHVEADITNLDKYTKLEVDNFLAVKANSTHFHTEADITDLDKYTKSEVDALIVGAGGNLTEAPIDGKQYARQDGEWAEVIGGSSELITTDTVVVYNPAKPNDELGYAYYAGNTFVSYVNVLSEIVQFQTEALYRCIVDALIAESPETNPEKWAYQGVQVLIANDNTGIVVIKTLESLKAITGYTVGDSVILLTTGQIYTYESGASEGVTPNDNNTGYGKWTTVVSDNTIVVRKSYNLTSGATITLLDGEDTVHTVENLQTTLTIVDGYTESPVKVTRYNLVVDNSYNSYPITVTWPTGSRTFWSSAVPTYIGAYETVNVFITLYGSTRLYNSSIDVTATEVRDLLHSLGGEDRLDASAIKNLPIEPAAGGFSNNIYLSNVDSDVIGYKTMSYTPDITETLISTNVSSSEGEKTVGTYLYPLPVGISTYPSGLWAFNFFLYLSSANGNTQIGITYFKHSAAGVETDLFTAWSDDIDNEIQTYKQIQITNPVYIVELTDRMGARVKIRTTNVSAITVNYVIGDGYGGWITTPNRIRHSQLRDYNGDSNYQHVTTTQISTWDAKQNAIGIDPILGDTLKYLDELGTFKAVDFSNGIISTTAFNKNLTSSEDTIQKAFDKIDDLVIPQTTTINVGTLEPYDSALSYAPGVYKSYVNLESTDIQFQTPAIYQSIADVEIGQTPETHPYDPETELGLWWYFGETVEVTSRSTAQGYVETTAALSLITGYKHNDSVNVKTGTGTVNVYVFDSASTSSTSTVKPTDIAMGDPGRWVLRQVVGGGSDAYSDSKSIIGGLNGFKLRYDRPVILSSINVDATKITNILIGKNGATPSTFTLPYTIALGDVIEFALTNVEPTYTYLTLNGTYND